MLQSAFRLHQFFLWRWMAFSIMSSLTLFWIIVLLRRAKPFTADHSTKLLFTVSNILLVLLISLSISSYKSFQVFLKSSCSSFLIARQYSITFIYNNLFSHSSIDRHPLDFQFLATTKRGAINIFAHVRPFQIFMISWGYSPRTGIARCMGMYIFVGLRV